MVRSSTSLIGVTSAAVPVKNTSSAPNRSPRVIERSRTSMPSSPSSFVTDARVMPSRIPAPTGGVETTPSRTTKMFSPDPSETMPSSVSITASSYPVRRASCLARIELRYWPVPLATGTKLDWEIRRHDEIRTRIP